MTSDEIINSKSIEYADSRFSNLDVGDYVKFASMSSYSDGYTQGRADAWKELEQKILASNGAGNLAGECYVTFEEVLKIVRGEND